MKLLLMLFLLFSVNNYAQEADAIVKKLQEKFQTIQDFKSSFHQTTKGLSAESDLTLNGKFNYKKKNKFKVELKNIDLISDGETIWNYDKRLNRVVINSVEDNQAFLNLDDLINNYPELCAAEIVKDSDSDKYYVVKLIPEENKLEFTSAILWIDKNYVLNKISIKDYSGSEYNVELSNIKLNQNMKPDEFSFKVPEGCKVIDFRQ